MGGEGGAIRGGDGEVGVVAVFDEPKSRGRVSWMISSRYDGWRSNLEMRSWRRVAPSMFAVMTGLIFAMDFVITERQSGASRLVDPDQIFRWTEEDAVLLIIYEYDLNNEQVQKLNI